MRGRRPRHPGNGGKMRQRGLPPMGFHRVVPLSAVQVLCLAHGSTKAGRILQVRQRQQQRPVRPAGETGHQAGVLQRNVQRRLAGGALVRGIGLGDSLGVYSGTKS